jgi:hypothetical protein
MTPRPFGDTWAEDGYDVVNRPQRDGPKWTRFVKTSDGTKQSDDLMDEIWEGIISDLDSDWTAYAYVSSVGIGA